MGANININLDPEEIEGQINQLNTDKRDVSAQKNSIEDDSGDLQLVNDIELPGPDKMYGTNAAGVKGWFDVPAGGDEAFVNEAKIYKALTNQQSNVNSSTNYQNVSLKSGVAGSFDNTVFAPVSNGVQLLKDIENVIISASVYGFDSVTSNGNRPSLGIAIGINGTISSIEGTTYIRRTNGVNEGAPVVTEVIPTLAAGDVVTLHIRALGAINTTLVSVEDKGALSILGFVPDTAGVIIGFPTPIVTSISLT